MNQPSNSRRITTSIRFMLCILLFTISSIAYSQPRKMVFEHITVQDGLPENSVFSMLQDHLGFLWLGTQNGLVKYDGYQMKIYTSDADNPHSIKGRSFFYLHEDRSGNIWVATIANGLNKFNRATEQFANYRHVPGDSASLGNNFVFFIHEDQKGFIWVITRDQRLQRLDPQTGTFTHYEHDPEDTNSISNNSISLFGIPLRVFSFLEDKNGNVWLGTTNGFNRYNHKTDSFVRYLPDSANSGSISGNIITSILESKDGQLWIGTGNGGLNRYDPETDTFTYFKNDPEDPNSINDNRVYFLFEEESDTLWLGTQVGLDRMDPNTGIFTHYRHDPANSSTPSHIIQMPLFEEKNGDILFLTGGGGLDLFNRQTGTFSHYRNDPDDPTSMSSDRTVAFLADRSGSLWFGTSNRGLNKLDRSQQKFTNYKKKEGDLNSLSDNRVSAIFESHSEPGIVWIGTRGGLNRFDRELNTYVHFKHDSLNDNSLSSNIILSIYEDSSGEMFIGTSQGFHRFNRKKGHFTRYMNDINDNTTLSNNRVNDILEDHTGTLWISTEGGLNQFDKETGKFIRYMYIDTTYHRTVFKTIETSIQQGRILSEIVKVGNDQNISKTFTIEKEATILIVSMGEGTTQMFDFGSIELDGNTIWEMDLDSTKHAGGAAKNRIEIVMKTLEPGTYTLRYQTDDSHSYRNWNDLPPHRQEFWGVRVFSLNQTETDTLLAYIDQFEYGISIPQNRVRPIFEDRSGTLWFGTNNNGVFRYNRDRDDFTAFYDESRGLVSVLDIFEDASGRLWLADYIGGLLEFDRETGSTNAYTVQDGLPANSVNVILQDEGGFLWLGTFNGLTKFDTRNSVFTTFDASNGLLGHQISRAYKNSTGEMFFGGPDGLNVFSPDQMQTNTIPPTIALTGFNLFDQPVEIGDDSPLKQHISIAQNVDLAYNQNDISFEFAALHFSRPKKNEYAYKLDNYDSDWRYVGNKHTANYTNLDPGEYIFHVKAANSDGVWNEEGTSINIVINPPFWKTWWAYAIYLVLLISAIVTVGSYQRRRVVQKERNKAILAENQRRAKELEEARTLQLSMLPKTVPSLPNLEIAVYMNPATEVGGDYYDFHVSNDGTLTVAVGDATGHGLNAGMMVTATKSLFESLAPEVEVLGFMNQSNRVLKNMNLRTLNMAMTMLKIKGSKIAICGAGMPPLLIHRVAENKMEEILLKGMPLGCVEEFPYKEQVLSISAGDTLLLMSDGFPERFNVQGDYMGYDEAYKVFEEIATKSPKEIIDYLVKTGDEWANGRPQDDDVTFVVMRVKT